MVAPEPELNATFVALVAVPAVAAFRFATCVVLDTVNGAVPVATVEVITPVAETVVNAPVFAVVAPTVPLMLMDAVPVKFVTVPLAGVPKAPLKSTNAPADPVFTAKADATPVPKPLTPEDMGNPVTFVSVPELGVPKAPPFTTKAPTEPVFTPKAVTTPVPVVMVLGADPAPPPTINAFADKRELDAHVLALEK